MGLGDTPEANYVRALYQLLLGRAAGSGEVAGWVGGLDSAPGRPAAALTFLCSREFRTDTFEGYYNALLHRPDDPAGLAGWLASGLDAHAVRLAFESSAEFFANG
jgi:hypothetical protein